MILKAISLIVLLVSAVQASTPDHGWSMATDDTRVGLAVVGNQIVITQLQCPTSGQNWAGQGMVVPLMAKVWAGGRECPAAWVFVKGEEDHDRGTTTLRFSNAEPKLELRSVWRARAGRGPVEHWIEVENLSGQTIALPQQDSLALLGLRMPAAAKIWWIRRGGSNASTQGGVFTESVVADHDLVLSSDPEDGGSPVPWLDVQVGEQGGMYVGWEFSGLGRVEAKTGKATDVMDVHVGNHPDFKTDISAGETFHVPPAFVGCYAGDIDDGSYSLHRFIGQVTATQGQ